MSVLYKRDYRIIRFLDTPVTDSRLNNTFEILTRNHFKDGEKRKQKCRSVHWAGGAGKIVSVGAFLRSAPRSSVLSLLYFTYSTLILHVLSSHPYHCMLSLYSSTVITSDIIIIFITIISQVFFFTTTNFADYSFVCHRVPLLFLRYSRLSFPDDIPSISIRPSRVRDRSGFRSRHSHPPGHTFLVGLGQVLFLVFSRSETFAAGEISSSDDERGKDTAFVRKIYYT